MDNRVEKSILFIAKNFRTELVLGDLAKEIGLSKFHFHRLFKVKTGLTPLAYINKLKLEHAIHYLILYPNSKQLEIAFESGYSSPVVFARKFKQYYGTSPLVFRKKKLGVKRKIEQQSKEYSNLNISYLKKKKVSVLRSNLTKNNLSVIYEKLIKKVNEPNFSIGFYIDTPLHTDLEDCRYFAGLESKKADTNQLFFEIEEGYYTYFDIYGEFEKVNKQIIEYKEKIIDPSPYEISSFIAFEKIKLPSKASDFDYFSIKRTLFVKIKRK